MWRFKVYRVKLGQTFRNNYGTSWNIMMTSSNGSIFRVTDPLCGNSPVTGEFPLQRPVTRSFKVFFDLRLNKRLNKQSRRLWFETRSRSLWRHCDIRIIPYIGQHWDVVCSSLLDDRRSWLKCFQHTYGNTRYWLCKYWLKYRSQNIRL